MSEEPEEEFHHKPRKVPYWEIPEEYEKVKAGALKVQKPKVEAPPLFYEKKKAEKKKEPEKTGLEAFF